MLTAENEVVTADSQAEITLARGCSQQQLRTLEGSVGDAGTTAPSDDEAKAQVGEVPQFGALIEFTTDPSVAMRFGTGGYVVAIRIKRCYLTRGSLAECGWICRKEAPITILGSKAGRKFI